MIKKKTKDAKNTSLKLDDKIIIDMNYEGHLLWI